MFNSGTDKKMENDTLDTSGMVKQFDTIPDFETTDTENTNDMDITDMVNTVSTRVLEDHVKQKMWSFEYIPSIAKLWFLLVSVLLITLVVCVLILIFQ